MPIFKSSSLSPRPVYTFFSSVFLLLLLNILVKPLWIFAIDRQVQNVVGLETYGSYFALLNISIVFNFLLDLGITNYYNTKAAAQTHFDTHQFLETGLLKFYLGISYAIILTAIGYFSGIANIQLLVLLAMMQFLYSMFVFLRGQVTALQLFSTDAWLSIIDKSIMILCCGVLLYRPGAFGSITILRFVWLQVIATFIAILVAGYIVMMHGSISTIKIKLPFTILRSAWPYGAIMLVMSAINRQDAFLLERLHPHGDYEAGVYASAYRLLDAANVAGYLVSGFLLSYISRNWKNDPQLSKVISLCRNLLIVLAIGMISVTCIFAVPLQRILYHTENLYQVSIIQLCIPSLIGYYLVQIYGTVLTASGNIRLFLKLSIPFMVVNLSLNIFLVPKYGATACCYIAIVTQLLYGMILWRVARKKIYARVVTEAIPNFK